MGRNSMKTFFQVILKIPLKEFLEEIYETILEELWDFFMDMDTLKKISKETKEKKSERSEKQIFCRNSCKNCIAFEGSRGILENIPQ